MGVPRSILEVKGDSVRLTLVDAMSVRPIANTEVEIYSDNGIRCIKAPCPTDGKSWKGASDVFGLVTIPRSALNTTAHIKSATYQGDLIEDVVPGASGGWRAELLPVESAEPLPHPLKLIDARTLSPIANATVRIESRNPTAPVDSTIATSNALGYIFVPATVLAQNPETSWLVAPGYADTHIDFAYARRKMLLVPR